MSETANTLVKVDPKEFGIEESKAAQIEAQFKPMLEKMTELESEFNKVIQLDIEDPATAMEAKALRMKYVKVRTGTAAIHKEQKAFYLAAGRFVDGWKNAQLFAGEGIEAKLEAIEKHQEIKQQQALKAKFEERAALLAPYGVENVETIGLGHMADAVWDNFLAGTKQAYEQKIAAAQKAEEERIAKEKFEAEERARLQAELEAKEKELAAERAEAERQRQEAEAKVQAEREKAEAERKIQEEAARKEREEAAAKLKAEQEAKTKLEAEIRAKEEAEAKAKAEAEKKAADEEKARKAAEKKAAAAPDKAKLELLATKIDEFAVANGSLELKSEEAKQILKDTDALLAKVSKFIRDKSEAL